MGVGGISIWQLLIILAIVIMIFGTKKLKSLGTDLGSAVKGFRSSVTDKAESDATDESIDANQVTSETDDSATMQKANEKEKEKA